MKGTLMKERKDIPLTVRLFSSMHTAITIAARQTSTSPSWIVRRAIRDYLITHHPEAIAEATEKEKENKSEEE